MNKKKIGILLISAGIIVGAATILRVKGLQESGLALSTEPDLVGGVILGAAASAEELPDMLSIPKLGITASVQHLGITKSGNMAAPDNFSDVSWYKYGTVPGEEGSAVMAGHDNGIYVRGVFKRLNELKVGDDVYVDRGDGKRLHFKVIETAVYPYNEAPLKKIFGRKDGTYLNLITCTGKWNEAIGSSDHRLVVYTELVK